MCVGIARQRCPNRLFLFVQFLSSLHRTRLPSMIHPTPTGLQVSKSSSPFGGAGDGERFVNQLRVIVVIVVIVVEKYRQQALQFNNCCMSESA